MEMNQYVWVIISTFISAFASGVSGYIVWLLKQAKKEETEQRIESKKKEAALLKGMRCVLRQNLIENHDKYVHKNAITIHGHENVSEMMEAYEALDGNGTVRIMTKQTLALPVEE